MLIPEAQDLGYTLAYETMHDDMGVKNGQVWLSSFQAHTL